MTEDILRIERDALQDGYDLLPMGIVIVDANGLIVATNRHLEQLLGYRRFELVGKSVEILLPKAFEHRHRKLRQDYSREAIARHMGAGRELVARHRDGRTIPVEVGLNPVNRQAERLVVCTVVDVSERRELQGRLQQVQSEVEIGNLVGGIAHDFNNILLAIGGYVELCKEKAAGDPELLGDLGEALEAMKRGREFVTSILDRAGKREPAQSLAQWERIIEDSMRLLRLTLPANVNVRVHPASDIPDVTADPVELRRVFVNLLTNAVHATASEGGAVDVKLEVARVEQGVKERAPELDPGAYVRLSVIDNGVGMSQSVLDRAFEPHFTTKSDETGRGLGLSVTRRIIRSLGGEVVITSREGQGTRVDTYVPVASNVTSGPSDGFHGASKRTAIANEEATHGAESVMG